MTRAQRRARANSLVEKSFRKEKIARACPSFFFLSRTRKKENVVGARFLSSKQKRAERPVRRVARRPRISLFFSRARALRVFAFSRLTEKTRKRTKAARAKKKRRKTRKFRRRRDDRERPRFRARAASAREKSEKKKRKKRTVREKRLSRTKRIFLFFSLFSSRAESRGSCAREKRRKSACESRPLRNPTTSFLTATTRIYAIGAGITAAAGTRLALQSFLVEKTERDLN